MSFSLCEISLCWFEEQIFALFHGEVRPGPCAPNQNTHIIVSVLSGRYFIARDTEVNAGIFTILSDSL